MESETGGRGAFSFTDHHDKLYLYIKILHTFLLISGHKEFDNHARTVMQEVSRYIPYVCLQKKRISAIWSARFEF